MRKEVAEPQSTQWRRKARKR